MSIPTLMMFIVQIGVGIDRTTHSSIVQDKLKQRVNLYLEVLFITSHPSLPPSILPGCHNNPFTVPGGNIIYMKKSGMLIASLRGWIKDSGLTQGVDDKRNTQRNNIKCNVLNSVFGFDFHQSL